jgi:hypothetical protein
MGSESNIFMKLENRGKGVAKKPTSSPMSSSPAGIKSFI